MYIINRIAAFHDDMIVSRRNHNDPGLIAVCVAVARRIVGAENVNNDHDPGIGSDDFSSMSNHVPGVYVWIDLGLAETGRVLHNPRYEFSNDIVSIGASRWARLVEAELPRKD